MNKQIKMSYAGKDVRLTVDENDKLVKVEVRKAGDPNQFEEVKSTWIGKTPSWNKLDEFLSEAAGVKVQRRRLFESFESVKAELHDAPVEIKEAFNSVVNYFDGKSGKEVYNSDSYGYIDPDIQSYAIKEAAFSRLSEIDMYKAYIALKKSLVKVDNYRQSFAALAGAAEGANIHRLAERINNSEYVTWDGYIGLKERVGKGFNFVTNQEVLNQLRNARRSVKGSEVTEFISKFRNKVPDEEATRLISKDYPRDYGSYGKGKGDTYASDSYQSDSYD